MKVKFVFIEINFTLETKNSTETGKQQAVIILTCRKTFDNSFFTCEFLPLTKLLIGLKILILCDTLV